MELLETTSISTVFNATAEIFLKKDLYVVLLALDKAGHLRHLTDFDRPSVAGLYANFFEDNGGNGWLYFDFSRSYIFTRYIAIIKADHVSAISELCHDDTLDCSKKICSIAKRALKDAHCWQAITHNQTPGGAAMPRQTMTHIGGLNLDTFFTLSKKGLYLA